MTVALAPMAVLQFFDANSVELTGGKLFTYAAGSTTPLATYTDSTGSTPNTNPIILDARGQANVWLTLNTAYKFVLSPSTDTNPPTNPIWTVDNITAPGGVTSFNTRTGAVVLLAADVTGVLSANVTNAMLANMAADTIKTNPSGGTGAPTDETSTAFIARKNLGTANIVQVTHGGSYSLVAGDENKEHFFTASATVTIPSNASVPLATGSFYKLSAASGTTLTVQITTDTLVFLPGSSTGTRTVTGRGFVVVTKELSTEWWVSGSANTA